MTHADRETGVLAAVVALVDTLLDDFDVVEMLTELTERCAQLLDVASAGLLLGGPTQQLHLVAATSERTEELELFQLQLDEGPCRDCFFTGAPVSVADLPAASERWPQFVPAAADAGFASVHALPMHAAGTVLGALGLFGTHVGALNEDDLVVGRTLAHVASVAILFGGGPQPETVLPNLRRALSSRIVIEQAKGFLHERLDLQMEAAFGLLRRYAATHQVHLTDLARRLMSEREARPVLLTDLAELAAAPR